MRAQAWMLSALAIATTQASSAAADPAGPAIAITEVRLTGISDPKQERRWLALLRARPGSEVTAEQVSADIRRLWETAQFSDVGAELAGRTLVYKVAVRPPRVEVKAAPAPKVAVEFAGNSGISSRRLKRQLLSHGKPLDRDELWRDELRLRAAYRDRGYLDVSIAKPAVGLSTDRKTAHVRFAISEGPRYRLGAVAGTKALKVGTAFSHTAVSKIVATMRAELGESGHAFAVVAPRLRLDRDAHLVDVSFVREPGPVATVAGVIIRGNKRTRDSVIRREIDVIEGEPFTASAVARSRARITALGFFNAVEVETQPGEQPGDAVVVFTVEERPTGTFQIGAGFSTLENFIASAAISQSNLFGTGQSLHLAAQLSAIRQLFTLRWSNPRVADSRWGVAAEIYNARRVWSGFVREAIGGAATASRQLGDNLSASVTYRLEQVSARRGDSVWTSARRDRPELAGPELFKEGLISSLRVSLAHDSRDDRLRPRRGAEIGGFGEIASPLIGSEVELARAGGWARVHQPVAGGVVAHAGAEIGLVSTRDPAGVPLAHRYQIGGPGSVRGYEVGSLGPRIKLGGDPNDELGEIGLGGNLMAKATFELTAPLISSIGLSGVVFADVGNVFNLDRRYCDVAGCPQTLAAIYRGLRASVGFGFRWFSPIGPLRFEWGIPLFRRPGDPWIRFHFGVGLGL